MSGGSRKAGPVSDPYRRIADARDDRLAPYGEVKVREQAGSNIAALPKPPLNEGEWSSETVVPELWPLTQQEVTKAVS